MAYGNALQTALHSMSQPAGSAHVGQPPGSSNMRTQNIQPSVGNPDQSGGQAKIGQPPAQQPPKSLADVLHEMLEGTSTKLDGHQLMDLIRATIQHGASGVANASNAVQPMLDKLLNPVLGGAVGGLSQPTILPPSSGQ